MFTRCPAPRAVPGDVKSVCTVSYPTSTSKEIDSCVASSLSWKSDGSIDGNGQSGRFRWPQAEDCLGFHRAGCGWSDSHLTPTSAVLLKGLWRVRKSYSQAQFIITDDRCGGKGYVLPTTPSASTAGKSTACDNGYGCKMVDTHRSSGTRHRNNHRTRIEARTSMMFPRCKTSATPPRCCPRHPVLVYHQHNPYGIGTVY